MSNSSNTAESSVPATPTVMPPATEGDPDSSSDAQTDVEDAPAAAASDESGALKTEQKDAAPVKKASKRDAVPRDNASHSSSHEESLPRPKQEHSGGALTLSDRLRFSRNIAKAKR